MIPGAAAPCDRNQQAFTPASFCSVLGNFPTGVAVVTAAGRAGELYGVTVSSFNAVSLDPPLVLFCLARSLNSLDAFQRSTAFALNFLGDDQAHLSTRFATALADKWRDVPFRRGHTGSPILMQSVAAIECLPYAQHDGGDHVIVIGRVAHIESDPRRMPLVYFRGRYHTLSGEDREK